MRAIDLYAGIGGWSLGLKLAGIDVVESYEWWQPAIETHNGNHNGTLKPVDIRKLQLADLPQQIDLVVGSPPCTEFSYANRGGRGDVTEGLKDLVKFLEVVDYLKPKYWALENVPRVAQVMEYGFQNPAHALFRFRHLKPQIHVVDFADFGTPQARKRCIAGNIPFDLLAKYKPLVGRRTLGDVVHGLATAGEVTDPVWGVVVPSEKLTETQPEPALNGEELRMNRESKEFHPVYNNMAFPDRFDEPSRTVTATCTRVSRESVVISDPKAKGTYRRLSIRERASLQGFPITYQFYARSFAEKAKMIGNAIPPTFTYLVGVAARGIPVSKFPAFDFAGSQLTLPEKAAPVTPPDKEGRSYPATRAFRAALPGLRFKSGMRFELSNRRGGGGHVWAVSFFFGSSKDIREVDLDGSITDDLSATPFTAAVGELRATFRNAEKMLAGTTPTLLQEAWTRRHEGIGPYAVVDLLGDLAEKLYIAFEQAEISPQLTAKYVSMVASQGVEEERLPNKSKLERYALRVLAGFVVGEWFNTLAWHNQQRAAA